MTMISGEKLGAALTQAMQLKGVGPKEVAKHFDIKPPSVKDWQKRATKTQSRSFQEAC